MLATMPDRPEAASTDTPDILDLVLRHEHEIGRLLSAIDQHEEMLAVELRPAVAARRDEIAGAQRRLASIRDQHALAARLERVTSSWSWRATAPARRIGDWFRAITTRANGDRS